MIPSSHLAASLIFGSWLALSVVRQVNPGLSRRVEILRKIGLTPSWRLFGPRPLTVDFAISFRLREPGGVVAPWVPLHLVPVTNWSSMFWNPRRRVRKVLNHSVKHILRMLRSGASLRHVEASVSYRRLRAAVRQASRNSALPTQFVIESHRAWQAGGGRTTLFTSPFF